jgi:hypothetical protein
VHNIPRTLIGKNLRAPDGSSNPRSGMQEFLTTPTARIVLWVAVLLIMMAVGYYVVRRFRDRIDDDRQTASDLLTNFREMQHGGDISEKEFRTIKTVLEQELHAEMNDRKDDEA